MYKTSCNNKVSDDPTFPDKPASVGWASGHHVYRLVQDV